MSAKTFVIEVAPQDSRKKLEDTLAHEIAHGYDLSKSPNQFWDDTNASRACVPSPCNQEELNATFWENEVDRELGIPTPQGYGPAIAGNNNLSAVVLFNGDLRAVNDAIGDMGSDPGDSEGSGEGSRPADSPSTQ